MKYGLDICTVGDFADPRILADLAVDAEEAGWDGFFIWDVLFAENEPTLPVTDPWIALAAIATRTQRIKVGAMLTPLARRRPWQVARETVALDYLSNGRLVFGAGLGYQELDFVPFGEEYDAKIRAEKLDEGLEVLKGLWTGEAFHFRGKQYHVDVPAFLPTPLQFPRIPVWLAGGWPNRKPLRRAAHWDGIYLMSFNQVTGKSLTSEEVREIVAYINSYRTDARLFDIVVSGELPVEPDKQAEKLHKYEEVGATWWISYRVEGQSLMEFRDYIRQGPPEHR